jgi:hypothetical protein
MSGVIIEDSKAALSVARWLWEHFNAHGWNQPQLMTDLNYQRILARIDYYVLTYLEITNPKWKVWPSGAVCPGRLAEYLLLLIPALLCAGRGALSECEIAKIDDAIIDYSIIMANNGVPMLPICIAIEQLWQQATRGSD